MARPSSVPLVMFHNAVIQSRRIFSLLAESQVRSLLASPESGGGGHRRAVLDGSGKPAFEVHPLRAAQHLEMDPDLYDLTYGPGAHARGDIYKRDGRGALVPLVVTEPLPAATLIHLARSCWPEHFNPSDKREVDTKHSVEVLVIGDQKPKVQSSLRADLEARLAEIRNNPNRPTAKPSGPVAMIGTGHNDPPERVTALADDGPTRLADNPRVYHAPPSHVPGPTPNYARPAKIDQSGQGHGPPPPGGMRKA